MKKQVLTLGLSLFTASLAACENDNATSKNDVIQQLPDTPTEEGLIVKTFALSPSGHDRLYGVAVDDKGNIFATGQLAASTDSTADYSFLLAKFTPAGELDSSFANKGLAVRNVAVGTNGELARGIVIQSDGKIVIAGTIEHAGATDPRDRDIAVLRFNSDGSLDTTFQNNGMLILDLSVGTPTDTGYIADNFWGLSKYDDDRLLLTGAQKNPLGTDTDFAVVRLSANGDLDSSFGNGGIFTLDIDHLNASTRTATLLPEGGIVISGYMKTAVATQPVLFKLLESGQLDTTFGTQGIFTQAVLSNAAEVYAGYMQGDSFITTGYGKGTDAAESLDWISLRISAQGTLDHSYGNNGVARIDVAGFNDNSRALTVLPDGRILLVGGGRTTSDNIDTMVALLTADGQPDTSFASTGYKLFDLGQPSDFLWAVTLAPNQDSAVMVGIRGVGANAGDDDSALIILALQP